MGANAKSTIKNEQNRTIARMQKFASVVIISARDRGVLRKLYSVLRALVKENKPVNASTLSSQSAVICCFVIAAKGSVCLGVAGGTRTVQLSDPKYVLIRMFNLKVF